MTSIDPGSGMRPVLSGAEAAYYLGLSNGKGVQRLVDRGELVPLTYSKQNLFAVSELDRFLIAHLEQERAIRRPKP